MTIITFLKLFFRHWESINNPKKKWNIPDNRHNLSLLLLTNCGNFTSSYRDEPSENYINPDHGACI